MTDTAAEIVFNGINGSTGAYVTPPMTLADIANVALNKPFDTSDPHAADLQHRKDVMDLGDTCAHPSVDPKDLSTSGWGVIFTHDVDPAIKEALKPLLDHRQALAARSFEKYYQEYIYAPGQSKGEFLSQYKVGPGPADPENMPYYLLIVGDPTKIPFEFQYQLDVQYAVGRICFDTPEEYAIYAQSVVDVETGKAAQLPRKAAFFAVRNPDDKATRLSCDQLTLPLLQKLQEEQAKGGKRWKGPRWDYQLVAKEEATKARLMDFLGGKDTPALLFTASHGMGFDLGDPRQLPHQGAFLCQDWPGPNEWKASIPQDFYIAADDLADDARLLGLITFHFACFGVGTPKFDQFNHLRPGQMKEIAPHDFIARLPRRMLSHPKGGALAVIGHVERAWGYSFLWEGVGAHLTAFESMMADLLSDGRPVGAALEYFNERYAELASDLGDEIQKVTYFGKRRNDQKIAGMWTANNDSRNYIIFGDPAVRLAVGDATAVAPDRPTVGTVRVPQAAARTIPPEPAATVAHAPAAAPAPPTAEQRTAIIAQLLAHAAQDAALRQALLENPRQAAATLGVELPAGITINVHEETGDSWHLVLPPA